MQFILSRHSKPLKENIKIKSPIPYTGITIFPLHVRTVLRKRTRDTDIYSDRPWPYLTSREANVFLSAETFLLSKCRKASRPRASKRGEITLCSKKRACPKRRFLIPLFYFFFLLCLSASRISHRCWRYICIYTSNKPEREGGEGGMLLISDILARYSVSYFEASHGPFLCSKGELAIAIAVCFSFFQSPFFFY